MNNIYTRPDIYYARWITPLLQAAGQEHPVVVLTGARQVGKSTLLLNAEPFCNWRFYTLDNYDVLRQASQEPEALWAGVDRVVIDEVQKAPKLLSAVKKAVDQNPGRSRFTVLDKFESLSIFELSSLHCCRLQQHRYRLNFYLVQSSYKLWCVRRQR